MRRRRPGRYLARSVSGLSCPDSHPLSVELQHLRRLPRWLRGSARGIRQRSPADFAFPRAAKHCRYAETLTALASNTMAVLEDWSIISRRPAAINDLPAKSVDRFLVEGKKGSIRKSVSSLKWRTTQRLRSW